MSGYQEVLTDPSYTGQLVTMTYPLIGNYGVNTEDRESPVPQVAGFIVREASRIHSSWRSEEGLDEYLGRHGITGISDIDTRALTRHIRSQGAMRGAIAPADMQTEKVMDRIQGHPNMEGLDLACGVSTSEPYEISAVGDERFHVLAFDFGVKAHSPKLLSERGCRVTVIPADTPAEDILSDPPDGLFVSNGPGDPAAVEKAEAAILGLAEADIPVFGICLGHQLICRAFGASTFKLPFGHHGGNHPVKFLEKQTVEITSQNHGFAVEDPVQGMLAPHPSGACSETSDNVLGAEFRVRHVNSNDGTVEGLDLLDKPAFTIQFHPEACPGPHDASPLFDRFQQMVAEHLASPEAELVSNEGGS